MNHLPNSESIDSSSPSLEPASSVAVASPTLHGAVGNRGDPFGGGPCGGGGGGLHGAAAAKLGGGGPFGGVGISFAPPRPHFDAFGKTGGA